MYVHFLVARFWKIILLSVQYKCFNLVMRIRCSKIWSSAQDYAVLVVLLNMVESFISAWPKRSGGNDLYQLGTSSQKANGRGWPFNIFEWFIGNWGITGPGHILTINSALISLTRIVFYRCWLVTFHFIVVVWIRESGSNSYQEKARCGRHLANSSTALKPILRLLHAAEFFIWGVEKRVTVDSWFSGNTKKTSNGFFRRIQI